MCTSFKVLQYSILRMILYFVPVRNLHVLQKKDVSRTMDSRNSAQDVMRCDLCETHVPPLYCNVCSINLLGNIS